MTTNTIEVFRHVRNAKNGKITNSGGVTLYIQVTGNQFIASAAICSDTDNFNTSTARKIAHGRFLKGKYLTMGTYDNTKSLVDNVIHALQLESHLHSSTSYIIERFNSSEQGTALVKLVRYTKRLPRQPFTGLSLKKHKAQMGINAEFTGMDQLMFEEEQARLGTVYHPTSSPIASKRSLPDRITVSEQM